MKKTLSKIVACFLVVGVLLASTPFLIKLKADSIVDNGVIDGDINEYWHLDAYIEENVFHIALYSYDDYDITIPRISVLINDYDNISYSDSSSTMQEYDTFNLIFNSSLLIWQGSYDLSELLSNDYVCYINFVFSSPMSYISNQTFTIGFYKNANAEVYRQGYQAGQTDTIINTNPTNLISRFGQGVNSILSIPVFGSITLGTLVFIPLSMAVLLLLLKIWRRN